MSIIIFLLFMSICLGLIYLVHKYYRKEHFYLLGIIYSIIGFIMSKLLDKLVPEHHVHKKNHDSKNKNLFHVGIITLVGIMLHNITEGVALYTVLENNTNILGLFTLGIIIHNIPLGIALSSPIYYSTNNKLKTLIYTGFATFSTLVGGVIGLIFSSFFIKFNLPIYILGITSGMLIYVVFDELLPTAIRYNKKYYISLLIGIIIMILLSII